MTGLRYSLITQMKKILTILLARIIFVTAVRFVTVWWTETMQIRTLLSVFQKSGSALSLICLKNCKRAYSSSISS